MAGTRRFVWMDKYAFIQYARRFWGLDSKEARRTFDRMCLDQSHTGWTFDQHSAEVGVPIGGPSHALRRRHRLLSRRIRDGGRL